MAPASLVSSMSMSVISQAGPDNFVTAGPCLRRPGEGRTRPQKQPPAAVMESSDIMSPGSASPPEFPSAAGGELADDLLSEVVELPVEPPVAAEMYGSGKRILSCEEISRHQTRDDAWIVVNGKVYDVTQFLEFHPGGHEVILEFLQSDVAKDAGPLMRGEVGEGAHSHSKSAFSILEQFLVGSTAEESSYVAVKENHGKKYRHQIDLTKPIVPQVGHLGADYEDWVHDPVLSKETPRFFENDVFEEASCSFGAYADLLLINYVGQLALRRKHRLRSRSLPNRSNGGRSESTFRAIVKEGSLRDETEGTRGRAESKHRQGRKGKSFCGKH